MNHRLPFFLLLLVLWPLAMTAQATVTLTPKPKSMGVASGTLPLPAAFSIACDGLDEAMLGEVARFSTALEAATGITVGVADGGDALVRVSLPANTRGKVDGSYKMKVTGTGVDIEAKDALSLFYAFQTFKKLLPPNVMAAARDTTAAYALPLVTITDEPRFQYRGFMLDVSRHFFSVAEVKRMLDVMSFYKMNKFHWHLTDDQGWRAEIRKYPRLTTVGAMAPNSRFTSLEEAKAWWTNKPYGPYFYTQDEMREVVAYARERHIDVIPEVDMPGHFCAAMAAYPEYSCTPDGSHEVKSDGGVYADVLNVANPKAMQFVYDIIDELTDIFPYEYIHIGGDECPTTAWQNNADCQRLYREEGFSSWRQVQSWFINKVDSFVKTKGRKLTMWNESITESGADTGLMKATGAPIYCWSPADQAVAKANQLGLPAIYTPFGPYYINRRQGSGAQDPPGAGSGSDNVQATYNQAIPSGTDYGVQGTFWCEWVSDSTYMEWLALPRLIAIAEIGWTPQSRRSFDDFIARAAADTVLLNYGRYRYCTYLMPGSETPADMVLPRISNDSTQFWYRLVSGGTDADRKGRCIELLAEGSPLIGTYASNGAEAGRLWTNVQATEGSANYDHQWWSLEEDPAQPGRYALVCKASPGGSVNARPTTVAVSGRWTYDPSAKHYNFQLGTGGYGKKGDNYYYTIASDQAAGQYLNSSMPRQGLAVNVYSNPSDGGGGQWEFSPMADYGGDEPAPQPADSVRLSPGRLYVFTNTIDGFGATALTDGGTGSALTHSTDAFAANAWRVASAAPSADGSQTVTLQNAATGRAIATVGTYADRLGCPVSVGTSAGSVTLSPEAGHGDMRMLVGGKSLFPLPSGQVYAGATMNGAGYDAPRSQGAAWTAQEVRVVTFVCSDDRGAALGTVTRSVPVTVTEVGLDLCPSFKNTVARTITATAPDTCEVTYERMAYAVLYRASDSHGALVGEWEDTARVGESYTVALPAVRYYTLSAADATDGDTFVPDSDRTIHLIYNTDAITGVRCDGEPVTTVEAGRHYLLYDATTAAGRAGYRLVRPSDRQVNRSVKAEGLGANAVWTLEASGSGYRVCNVGTGLYVPQLQRSQPTTASEDGETFAFSLNSDGETWNICGRNGMYWDGIESGALVGWDGGTGHPIRISTFYARPMYSVTVTCTDQAGTVLRTSTDVVDAGAAYEIVIPDIEGYTLLSKTGDADYPGTVETYVQVTAVYAPVADGISTVGTKGGNHGAARYNLQGQRVGCAYKGIVVSGGRKFVAR